MPLYGRVPGSSEQTPGTPPRRSAQQLQNNDTGTSQKPDPSPKQNQKQDPSADRAQHQGSPSSADRRREQDAMLESLLCALRQQDREELERGWYESKREDDDDWSDEGVLCSKQDPNQVRPGEVCCVFVGLLHSSGCAVGNSRGVLCSSQEARDGSNRQS